MTLLDWFRTPPVFDPQLGELHRRRGAWQGTITLDGSTRVPLMLPGSRQAPDAESIRLASDAPQAWSKCQQDVARALFEHFEPYAESVAAGELEPPTGGLPAIARAADVWPYVTVEFVRVERIDGRLTLEIGMHVAWDEEHTLAARLRDGKFLELNGSVLGV